MITGDLREPAAPFLVENDKTGYSTT